MNKKDFTKYIKLRGFELGFLDIGFSKARFLEEERENVESWLKKNHNGDMQYMEKNFDKRLNPSLLVEGAKTVISFLYNYYPQTFQIDNKYKISKYAYGEDYHNVVKDKLKILLQEIKSIVGNINGRCFVDSAPILERAWAKNSGLGWIGKNSNLITKKIGSFYFLGEIILDIELEYDKNNSVDFCGSCNRCIESCPTNAIESPKIVNSNKCISYLTIEFKKDISDDIKYNNWIFGCDICQDVCPWNKFGTSHNENRFLPNEHILKNDDKFWEELSEHQYLDIFKKSPIKRAKYYKLKKNITFI